MARQSSTRRPRRAEQREMTVDTPQEQPALTPDGPITEAAKSIYTKLMRGAAVSSVAIDETASVQQAFTDPDPYNESWDAELPPATPEDIEHAAAGALSGVEPGEEEIDQMWDWVRADDDKGAKFLGSAPTTSRQLRDLLSQFQFLSALIEDTPNGPRFIGLFGFGPYNLKMAICHLYLGPEFRNRIKALVPRLMHLAQDSYPDVEMFAISTNDKALARLYEPMGFKTQYFLTWQPVRPVMITDKE
jgi:hypothetical protein